MVVTFRPPSPVAWSVNGPVGGMEYPMISFTGPRPEKDGTYPERTKYALIGVIIAYVKRDEARGTWLESHLTWLIGTFWWSTLWALIGWLVLIALAIVLIGFALGPLIWAVTAAWVLYRVIRGLLYFKDQRPIPGV